LPFRTLNQGLHQSGTAETALESGVGPWQFNPRPIKITQQERVVASICDSQNCGLLVCWMHDAEVSCHFEGCKAQTCTGTCAEGTGKEVNESFAILGSWTKLANTWNDIYLKQLNSAES